MIEDKDIAPALEATNQQLLIARETVQSLANEIADVVDVIEPTLSEFAKRLRASRMTTLEEIRQTISGLRELREFLLAKDTALSIERAQQLIAVVNALGEIRQTGILQALASLR